MGDQVDLKARKREAQILKIKAEARTETAKAREAEASAIKAELAARTAADADVAKRADDDYHKVYRFNGLVSADTVGRCIEKLTEWHRTDPDCTIEIIFNSPGGSIFDGMALFDFIVELGERGHQTITGGVGMSASMAGILVQSGQVRYLTKECWLLIHRAAFAALGQTFEVEDRVELIKRIEKRIIAIFVARSGGKITAQKIQKNWERKDFWLSSDECLELGLIDEIRGQVSAA